MGNQRRTCLGLLKTTGLAESLDSNIQPRGSTKWRGGGKWGGARLGGRAFHLAEGGGSVGGFPFPFRLTPNGIPLKEQRGVPPKKGTHQRLVPKQDMRCAQLKEHRGFELFVPEARPLAPESAQIRGLGDCVRFASYLFMGLDPNQPSSAFEVRLVSSSGYLEHV